MPNVLTLNGNVLTNNGNVLSVDSAGRGGGAPAKQINFIDYDGTILYSYSKEEINAMTSESDLPSNPSHDNLTAQGWNWTLAQIKEQLTSVPDGDVWVGQMYITTSGATEIDVTFDDVDHLSPYLGLAVNGTITVDWGDGSSTQTMTGTSNTSRVFLGHTYPSAKSYTIKITVNSGRFTVFGGSNYVPFLYTVNPSSADNRLSNRTYSSCIKFVRVGSNAYLDSQAFGNCSSLLYVTIPYGTSIGNYLFENSNSLISSTIPSTSTSVGVEMFQYCSSLLSVSIPSSVTSIGGYSFKYCTSLTSITIPSRVTSIGLEAFRYCYSLSCNILLKGAANYVLQDCHSIKAITWNNSASIGTSSFSGCCALKSITIPSTVTSIANGAFYDCFSLSSVIIPSNVSSIGNLAFGDCYSVSEYHVQRTTPPTLGTNVFNNINSATKIYVPSSALSTYQSNSSWITYSSYLVGE